MSEIWLCGRVNIICRNGELDLEDADKSSGIPMNIRYIGGAEGDDYAFSSITMTDDFDVDRLILEGNARNRAIEILRAKPEFWSDFCASAYWENIGAV